MSTDAFEGLSDDGHPVTPGWTMLATVRIPSYQRHEPTHRVDKMANNFKMIAAGAIIVSDRDGALWLVDGQTRASAARRCAILGLPSVTIEGLTLEEEAALFLHLNRDRLRVSALERHVAEVIAGETRAIEIDEVLNMNGLVASTSNEGDLQAYTAITSAETVYDDGGADLLFRVLQLLDKGLRADSQRFRGSFVKGLGYFLCRDPWEATDAKIMKALQRTESAKLDELAHHWKNALGSRTATGSPLFIAHAVATIVYPRNKSGEWNPKRIV